PVPGSVRAQRQVGLLINRQMRRGEIEDAGDVIFRKRIVAMAATEPPVEHTGVEVLGRRKVAVPIRNPEDYRAIGCSRIGTGRSERHIGDILALPSSTQSTHHITRVASLGVQEY